MFNLFTPDKKDRNKIFRNIMLLCLYFYFTITAIILIAIIFTDKNFDQFESYFITLSTVAIAAMTNYFYSVNKKEIEINKINSSKTNAMLKEDDLL